MLARQKLIQCFTCKNNLPCWGFDVDIPLGVNEKTKSIPSKALAFFITNNFEKTMSAGAEFGSLCGCFISTLKTNSDNIERDASQMVSLLCAICNTSNDGWMCPGECPKNEKTFVFERIK